MATVDEWEISAADREILRKLGSQVAQIAAQREQQERIDLWKKHNALDGAVRPLLYISPEGAWAELLPEQVLECEGEVAGALERDLRMRLYAQEHFFHDIPVLAEVDAYKVIQHSGWGLEVERVPSPTKRGSWHFVQVLHDEDDLEKITLPQISYDEAATMQRYNLLCDVFDGVLSVKLRGMSHISFHFLKEYSNWRGLEQTLYDMYEDPELLHKTLGLLLEGHQKELDQYEKLNLLSLNNDNTYHNSGGIGWIDSLPSEGFDPERVRLRDMWGSAESQEMAAVGPAQHKEFALDYEKPLLEKFALSGYGCCEDLTQKLDDVFAIKGIRRISISPWADVDACAKKMGGRYIYSWKPQPAHLVGGFNEEMIRQYLRHTIEVCADNGCCLEIILKDTHTCENRPERFDRWAQIAREEIRRVHG